VRSRGWSRRQESPNAGNVAVYCLLTKFLRTIIYPIAAILLTLSLVMPAAADMDGVMMHGGKMMMMNAGHPATAMDHEITLSDGAIVEVDGTVKSKDGKIFHLQEGEIILMDGHLMKGGKAAPMCH
jgi:hypothetical protein